MSPLIDCALLIANWLCGVCPTGACNASPRTEAARPASSAWTVTVSIDKPATIPEESLTIELASVKDDRCAAEVKCVWAGEAQVALRVSKAGAAPGPVVIGSPVPAGTGAPVPGYGAYEFSLVSLEPPNSLANPPPQVRYRATLRVHPRGSR